MAENSNPVLISDISTAVLEHSGVYKEPSQKEDTVFIIL